MNKSSLVAGALLVAAPVLTLIPGCGGGGGGLIGTATSTPVPTPTSLVSTTPTPNGTVGATQTSNFVLGSGQRAVLRFAVGGTNISGTLEVLDAPVFTDAVRKTKAQTQVYPGTIFAGTYVISGTLTPPRGYNLVVTQDGVTQFGLEGQLPTASQAGTYRLFSGSGSETGVLPKLGAAFPTATPRPTATPTSTPVPVGAVKTDLTFTPSSDSNFKNIPLIGGSLNLVTANGARTLQLVAQGAFNYDYDQVLGNFDNVAQGKSYTASSSNSDTFRVENTLEQSDGASAFTQLSFRLKSGSITVTSFTASTATVTYKNAVFSAQNNAGRATGTVTVNGTVSGPYSVNQPL